MRTPTSPRRATPEIAVSAARCSTAVVSIALVGVAAAAVSQTGTAVKVRART